MYGRLYTYTHKCSQKAETATSLLNSKLQRVSVLDGMPEVQWMKNTCPFLRLVKSFQGLLANDAVSLKF